MTGTTRTPARPDAIDDVVAVLIDRRALIASERPEDQASAEPYKRALATLLRVERMQVLSETAAIPPPRTVWRPGQPWPPRPPEQPRRPRADAASAAELSRGAAPSTHEETKRPIRANQKDVSK